VFFAFKNGSFVRSGAWKLVHHANENGDETALYNLTSDLQEQNDLSSENPELATRLQEKLSNWKQEIRKGVQPVAR